MADWQRHVWKELLAVEGVVPMAGGRVLVVGEGLPVSFAKDVLVSRKEWGEPLGDEAGFDRVFLLGHGQAHADFAVALGQLWRLLKPDGVVVCVVARRNPMGIRKSLWWGGYGARTWVRWLRNANWLVADMFTIGYSGAWARWMPCGGPIRVILAQKRVGGTRVLAVDARGRVVVKPAGIPV